MAKRKTASRKKSTAAKRKMLIEMSELGCGCGVGDLGRVRRKRRSRKSLGKLAVGACKSWRTKAGTLMRGCMTSKGFRIKGKARG